MPFHVHAIKYSSERVSPIAKVFCFALDEIPWQKAVKCTCCSAGIKCEAIYQLWSGDTRPQNVLYYLPHNVHAQRGLCSNRKANAFEWCLDSTEDFSNWVCTTEGRSSWGRIGLHVTGSGEEKAGTEVKLWHFCTVSWTWRGGLWRIQNNY